MKKLIILMTSILTVTIPALIYTQTMPDYCSVPPFVTRTVPPNVTIVFDNSGGMLTPAFSGEYDPSRRKDFIGYFKQDKTYCASTGSFYEAEVCLDSDKGPYAGSLLNWAAMSKYDIVMLVLIGGKGTPAPSSRDKLIGENADWNPRTTSAYPGCVFDVTNQGGLRITNTGGCTLPTISGTNGTSIIVSVNDYVPNVSPRGIIQDLVDRNSDGIWDAAAPKISIMRFQASQDDIKMDYCGGVSGPISSFIKGMASDQAKPDKNNPNAPLGLAMLRTIQYYSNACGTACSPCGDPVDSVQCRRNFVFTISSGEATDIPSRYSASYLNDQIRLAHTADIRADRDGTQVVNYFNIHIFGSSSGKDLLKAFSKYGGFIDSNSNQVPDLSNEWDKDWNGKPDTYYEASGASEIKAEIERAFQDIIAMAASGTAVSALTTSSRSAGSVVQAHFLPSKQEGTREVGWTGYLQNIWLDPYDNLREDSVHDCKLVLNEDKVMKLYFNTNTNETEAALFTTLSDGTGGTLSDCSDPEIKKFSRVQTLSEAGRRLALTNSSERVIFTSKRIIRGSRVTHMFNETRFPEFTTRMNQTLMNALNPDMTYTAENIVRYIRGECLETGVTGDIRCSSTPDSTYRDRRVSVDGSLRVWKLGDVINSSPKVFGSTPLNTYYIDYADKTYYEYVSTSSYRRKSSLVFVGANDGMLHAFRAGYLKDRGMIGSIKAILKDFFDSADAENGRIGEEIWAYIPFNAFPYLKYLADPSYCHIYFSDLSVRIVDASVNGRPEAVRDKNSWKTILIGGMRLGGASGPGGIPADAPSGSPSDVGYSSFFAIDITDPENPVPLWEFSDPDMGYSMTYPSVLRTGDRSRNGSWYVVVGSGSKVLPKAGVDIGRNTGGYVYILDLGTGDLVKKISLDHNAIVGDVLAVDIDKDYAAEKIYFGTSFKSGTTWKGKLVSINILSLLSTPAAFVSWDSTFGKTLFSGNYPFTASPEVVKDTNGNIWVYSGSGKYYSDLDESDTSQQIFFGLKDTDSLVAETALYDATNVSTSGEVAGTSQVCGFDSSTNSFRQKTVVTAVRQTSATPVETDPGWKIYLTEGERMISRPLAVGGLLDFLTYKPDSDPCRYGGYSNLYAVRYTSGAAPANVAIRAPEATSGVSGNVTVSKSIKLGPGAPPTGDGIKLSPPREGSEQLKKKIQVATGVIIEAENQPLFSIISKVIHWLKK